MAEKCLKCQGELPPQDFWTSEVTFDTLGGNNPLAIKIDFPPGAICAECKQNCAAWQCEECKRNGLPDCEAGILGQAIGSFPTVDNADEMDEEEWAIAGGWVQTGTLCDECYYKRFRECENCQEDFEIGIRTDATLCPKCTEGMGPTWEQ